MTGTIVTFYSYKGGVGRTFALANTAAMLARWGFRTLCVDWDLDAPGLTHYLRPWLSELPATGLVDLVSEVATGADPDPDDHVVSVALPGARARLDLLPAGSGDEEYVRRSQGLDWAQLYERHDLGGRLEQWRDRWKASYDFVLVDSRTGITDIGGICTAQLPEILVMLFTANEQSLGGTLDVARRARIAHNALPYDRAGLMIVPLPSRFDGREEYQRADEWQRRFATQLRPLVADWAAQEVSFDKLLGYLTIPYVSYWSFGEELPALAEPEPTPERISYALESVAALIAHRLDRTAWLVDRRDSYVSAAARAGLLAGGTNRYDVFISSSGANRELSEQVAAALAELELEVFGSHSPVPPGTDVDEYVRAAVAVSTALVVVLGDGLTRRQRLEVELFLRQSLDDRVDRPVVPVLVPGATLGRLPGLLSQFQLTRLRDGNSGEMVAFAHGVRRAVQSSRGASAAPGSISAEIRADAAAVLDDVRRWRLDELRWQLVEQAVSALADALETRDESALQALTSDLELLDPARSSGLSSSPAIAAPEGIRDLVVRLTERLTR